jgi:hypothetical protein
VDDRGSEKGSGGRLIAYILTVIATDNRSGEPVSGAAVSVTFRTTVFDLPKIVVLEGFTGFDGRVSWSTALQGLGQISATHEEYHDWVSTFNFGPGNPTASINMSNKTPVQMVKMTIDATSAAEGEVPERNISAITVDWRGSGGIGFKNQFFNEPDGTRSILYWPGMSGTYDVTFKLRWPTPPAIRSVFFPPEGGFETFTFKLDTVDFEDLPPVEEIVSEDVHQRLGTAIIMAYMTLKAPEIVKGIGGIIPG